MAETIFNRTNRGDTDKLAAAYFLVAEGEKLQLAVLTPRTKENKTGWLGIEMDVVKRRCSIIVQMSSVY